MTREARLASIVDALEQDISAGRVGVDKRDVTAADAADIAGALHDEMDRGVAARAALAKRDGLTIACKAGCGACCTNMIMVWEPEALAVARYLEDPENAAARARFIDRYPEWRERVGDAGDRASKLHLSGDRAAYRSTMQEVWSNRVTCAFDNEGNCSVYPARPNVCRNCHALDTADNCGPDAGAPPKAISFEPLDKFLAKSQKLTTALQVTMRRRNDGPSPLCTAVYELLTGARSRTAARPATKVGRNAPCPCGSGKKYKRCCGR